jgi:D-arabinonate dehydratase
MDSPKIRRIQVIPLIRKLDSEFQGSTYRIVSRNTLYVEVETDSGIVGEAFGGDEDIYQAKVVEVANHYLAPRLIGRELIPIDPLWQGMVDTAPLPFHNRGIHTLDLINHAVLMQAIAIIDLGLWDTLGKVMGRPVSGLLGAYRDKVPVVGIGGYHRDAEDSDGLIREVESFTAAGVCGIKLKVGSEEVSRDLRRVETVRRHFGDSFVLACDANQAWTFDQALQFAREAKRFGLAWLEEPVRWNDQLVGLRRLRDQTGVLVVAGQGEISSLGCRDLVLNGCVDILNVDATIAGGLTEWRRAATFAGMMNVQMGHHEEPQVAIHLLASVPNATYVEIFPNPERDPMWHELVAGKPRIEGGYMHVPQKPGFGLTYNYDVIRRYRGDGIQVSDAGRGV